MKLSVGKLGEGYFELMLSAKIKGADGQTVEANQKVCFGVTPFVKRSAEEVRSQGYRFGLKKWGAGRAGQ